MCNNKKKKLRFILLSVLMAITVTPVCGQTLTTFDPAEINEAAKKFNEAQTRTTKWAENIVALGNVNKNNEISYKFNVPSTDSLYIASIYDCIRMFVDQRRTERQIDYKNSSAEHVVILTVFPKILYSDGSVSFAMSVDAYGEMDIDIAPRSLTISMKVQKYVNTSPYGREVEPSYGAVWLPVGGVAPFQDNGNKKLWSKAFINSNAECLNLCEHLVDILNTHYTKPDYY